MFATAGEGVYNSGYSYQSDNFLCCGGKMKKFNFYQLKCPHTTAKNCLCVCLLYYCICGDGPAQMSLLICRDQIRTDCWVFSELLFANDLAPTDSPLPQESCTDQGACFSPFNVSIAWYPQTTTVSNVTTAAAVPQGRWQRQGKRGLLLPLYMCSYLLQSLSNALLLWRYYYLTPCCSPAVRRKEKTDTNSSRMICHVQKGWLGWPHPMKDLTC